MSFLILQVLSVNLNSLSMSSEPCGLEAMTDRFLVVATDDHWEFADNQETVEMVEAQSTPTDAVDVLVTELATRWMQEERVIDDTTILQHSQE